MNDEGAFKIHFWDTDDNYIGCALVWMFCPIEQVDYMVMHWCARHGYSIEDVNYDYEMVDEDTVNLVH